MGCSNCGSDQIRTFSVYNKDHWEWWKGCNTCNSEFRDTEEEKLHPECYERSEFSPAKINEDDVQVKQ